MSVTKKDQALESKGVRVRLITAFATLALCLAVSAAVNAQADQKLVVRCTYDGYNNQTLDFTIDLAAKTIHKTHTFKDPNGANVVQTSQPNLTEVTDDQITWTLTWTSPDRSATNSTTDTLNRYTGQIVEHVSMPGHGASTNTMSCQRQQKQF